MNNTSERHTPPEIEERFGVVTMTTGEARKAGYIPLTKPYMIDSKFDDIRRRDTQFFKNAIKTMQGANYVVVLMGQGPEIWRHNSELDVIPDIGIKMF
jgi:hypothetical protein